MPINVSYNQPDNEIHSYDGKVSAVIQDNSPLLIDIYMVAGEWSNGTKLYYRQESTGVDGLVNVSEDNSQQFSVPCMYLASGSLQVALVSPLQSQTTNLLSITITKVSTSEAASDDDPQFTLDNRKRLVLVPGSQNLLAIQYDNESEIITFKFPRYQEGVDLSTKTPYVNYKRPNTGDLGKSPCEFDQIEEETISFSWVVDANVTAYEGSIKFQIEFTDQAGYRWQSQIAELPILTSLYNTGMEPYTPSFLETLLQQVQERSLDAEAYALGTRSGVPVGIDDPAYENNAKYFAYSKHNGAVNDAVSVAQMLGVAQSYYNNRGTKEDPTYTYVTTGTPLDDDYDGNIKVHLDCSSFVGMCLRGIPAVVSAGPDPTDDGSDDSGSDTDDNDGGQTGGNWSRARNTEANSKTFAWAMNPSIYSTPVKKGDQPTPVRRASQLGEWMFHQGWAIELLPDFSNVQPGDIFFIAKRMRDEFGNLITDEVGNYVYKQPNRFMHISHVAFCYSVKPAPDDVTASQKTDVTVDSIDVDTALRWLEPLHGVQNNTYLVELNAGSWTIAKQTEPGVYGPGVQLTASSTDSDGNQLPAGTYRLVEIGTTVSPTGSTCSFLLKQYYWDRQRFPLMHTTMEVTDIAPFVLNRTYEKLTNKVADTVMICRPYLGAVRPNAFAGSLATDLAITNINNVFRDGSYYLTSAVTAGFEGSGWQSGTGLRLDVSSTYRKHGRVYSIRQILQDTRANSDGRICVRTQYCYSHDPDPALWGPFKTFIPDEMCVFHATQLDSESPISSLDSDFSHILSVLETVKYCWLDVVQEDGTHHLYRLAYHNSSEIAFETQELVYSNNTYHRLDLSIVITQSEDRGGSTSVTSIEYRKADTTLSGVVSLTSQV